MAETFPPDNHGRDPSHRAVRLAAGSDYGSLRMRALSKPYRGFRYPGEVIQHAVWLYHCFSPRLREVELILAVRSVAVSYESVRAWSLLRQADCRCSVMNPAIDR